MHWIWLRFCPQLPVGRLLEGALSRLAYVPAMLASAEHTPGLNHSTGCISSDGDGGASSSSNGGNDDGWQQHSGVSGSSVAVVGASHSDDWQLVRQCE